VVFVRGPKGFISAKDTVELAQQSYDQGAHDCLKTLVESGYLPLYVFELFHQALPRAICSPDSPTIDAQSRLG